MVHENFVAFPGMAFITVHSSMGKDELTAEVSRDEPRIVFTIRKEHGEGGFFLLSSEMAQKLVDWLKSQGAVS